MKKKWIIAGIIAVILGLCLLLHRNISAPADLTGSWYRIGSGECWLFEEGLLLRVDGEEQSFAGAYVFAGDTVSLFLMEDGTVSEIVELAFEHHFGGDTLCLRENPEEVWFCRTLDAAMK